MYFPKLLYACICMYVGLRESDRIQVLNDAHGPAFSRHLLMLSYGSWDQVMSYRNLQEVNSKVVFDSFEISKVTYLISSDHIRCIYSSCKYSKIPKRL
jgi:hypothetical protein